MFASDGHTLASGAQTTSDKEELALPLQALQPATYLVAWHTVSAVDGDPAHGYFAFAVGPDTPASGSIDQSADSGGTRARLAVSPGRVGANEYRVHVSDGGGNALASVTRVRLRIEDLDRDLGIAVVDLPQAGSDYVATGMELGLAGRFSVTVEVRRRDILDDLVYKFAATVPQVIASPSAGAPTGSAATPRPTSTPESSPTLAALAIAFIAAALVVGRILMARRR